MKKNINITITSKDALLDIDNNMTSLEIMVGIATLFQTLKPEMKRMLIPQLEMQIQ